MRLCVIPARGGSKRIPRKNIKLFNGKPIIIYSIEAALDSGCFDKVIVSTDDAEIAKISQDYGAEVPFVRPVELANDFSATIPVIKHAIEWADSIALKPEYVCCIYATAPFITPKIIQEAYAKLIESKADYCFSVTGFSFPIQRAVKITENDRLQMFHPECFETRSQDLEEAYHDAGQFYWGKSSAFKALKPLFSDGATPYILPIYRVQDIDVEDDWLRAELMYSALEKVGLD